MSTSIQIFWISNFGMKADFSPYIIFDKYLWLYLLLPTKYCFSRNYRLDTWQFLSSYNQLSYLQRQSECIYWKASDFFNTSGQIICPQRSNGGQSYTKYNLLLISSDFSYNFLVFSTQTAFVYKTWKVLSQNRQLLPNGHQNCHLHFFNLGQIISPPKFPE